MEQPVTLSPQSGTQRHLNRPFKRATRRNIERYAGSKQTVVNKSNLLNFKKSAQSSSKHPRCIPDVATPTAMPKTKNKLHSNACVPKFHMKQLSKRQSPDLKQNNSSRYFT
jgi:hypothetical protein